MPNAQDLVNAWPANVDELLKGGKYEGISSGTWLPQDPENGTGDMHLIASRESNLISSPTNGFVALVGAWVPPHPAPCKFVPHEANIKVITDAKLNAARVQGYDAVLKEVVAALRPFQKGKTCQLTSDEEYVLIKRESASDIIDALATTQNWINKNSEVGD